MDIKNTLVIVGASGHAKVLADCALLNGYQSIFFLDARFRQMTMHYGFPVLGDLELITSFDKEKTDFIVAIGDNVIRAKIIEDCQNQGLTLVNLIHPSATLSASVKLGVGILVAAQAVINPEATIATGVIINTAAVVEHDCVVDFCAHVSPNATLAGGVVVGARSWIGAGATVKQLCKIGKDTIIGMGAVVVSDFDAETVAVGVPAKKIKKKIKLS